MKTDTGGTIYMVAQGTLNSITAFEIKG